MLAPDISGCALIRHLPSHDVTNTLGGKVEKCCVRCCHHHHTLSWETVFSLLFIYIYIYMIYICLYLLLAFMCLEMDWFTAILFICPKAHHPTQNQNVTNSKICLYALPLSHHLASLCLSLLAFYFSITLINLYLCCFLPLPLVSGMNKDILMKDLPFLGDMYVNDTN